MKIFSIYYRHKPGGFCKRLYRLLNALATRGNDVTLYMLNEPPAGLLKGVQFKKLRFPIRQRDGVVFWIAFMLLAPFLVLFETFKHKPERFVVFNPFYAAIVAAAAVIFRLPTVLFVRSIVSKVNKLTERSSYEQAISNLLDRIGYWSSSYVVFMSNAMANEAASELGLKLRTFYLLGNDIPNIEDSIGSRAQRTPLRILTTSVLDPRKNIEVLIYAVAEASRTIGPDQIELTVAGNGPSLALLQEIARKELLSNVRFLGWRENLQETLRNTSLLVHPSLHEGISNSVLEAIGAGVPVLISDIPEHRELANANEKILFDPRSSSHLARRLMDLALKEEELKQLIQHCNALRTKFTFDWDTKASELAVISNGD